MKELVIFDTYAFFFRNFYALPPLKNKDGFPTGLLTGFVNFLHSLRTEYHEENFLFALEGKGEGFRKELYSEYKANRPPAPPELKQQLPVAIEWIKQMGFCHLSSDGYEADDIIATMALKAKDEGFRVKIVSSDKDLYQLIDDDRIVLFDPVKKIDINSEACFKKFGVQPEDFVEFQSILGDTSDNIPGVKGIGQKGASKLINEYKTLENIYENIKNITPKRTQSLLLESKEQAFLSRELVRLKTDLDIKLDIDSTKIGEINPLVKITDELIKYEMNQALDRVKRDSVVAPTKKVKKEDISFEVEIVNSQESADKLIEKIKKVDRLAYDIETDALETRVANIVGFGLALSPKEAYYIPLGHNYLGVEEQLEIEIAKSIIEEAFKKQVIGHNLKFDLGITEKHFGIFPEEYEDTMLLSWLLDPSSSIGLDGMMKRYFEHDMISFKDVVKKGSDFSKVEIDSAAKYCGEDVVATLLLRDKLQELMDKKDIKHLEKEAKEVEFPFIKTLIDIEKRGIKIDTEFFSNLQDETNKKLSSLTESIYSLAESEFNINSTQQLSKILFEKLKLKSGKKTKSGYSTDEKVLNKLVDEHEIIPKLLEYREVFKLKSTYIEPLLNYASHDKNSRIFTSFLQSGTATGRLSSKNPNLQNIPVRTELGRKIREGFVSEEGFKLVSLDYSQIELRLLAHFSKDSVMMDAFFDDKDIHYETAKKIFGEEEAKSKRDVAKSINFGLIYGMGARKLGETLKIPQKEAKEYIDSYFASFPTIKSFLSTLENEILQNGYSQTLLKRRRFFDFDGVAEYMKGAFLREGVNTLFQGSAADIIKLSMNRIDPLTSPKCQMLLQIHDELIFEVEDSETKRFGEELKEIMENIYKLNIPLKCELNIGENWGALK